MWRIPGQDYINQSIISPEKRSTNEKRKLDTLSEFHRLRSAQEAPSALGTPLEYLQNPWVRRSPHQCPERSGTLFLWERGPHFPLRTLLQHGPSCGWGRTAPPSGKAGAAHRLGRGRTPRRCARSRFAGPPNPAGLSTLGPARSAGGRFPGSLGFLRPGEGCAFGVTAGEAEGAARPRDLWHFRANPAGNKALDPPASGPPAVGNFPAPPAAPRGEKRPAPPPDPAVTTESREPARREAHSPCRPAASASHGDWKAGCDATRPVVGDKCDNPVPVLRDSTGNSLEQHYAFAT
ncbi:uncharacterized protein LOC101053791 [Saimiri boliviensis]|uniref:uncharacterized protein LOC101053791 n=1 Tax=Saimiri boliviensis TaxID=27679 RepID=UPI000533CEBD